MSGWRIELPVAAVYDRRSGAHRAPLQYFVCLLSSVLCLLSTACSRREPAPAGHVFRIAQRNEPATLDPQRATLPDEFFIIRALSEGLLTPDPAGGAPLPGAAERWEVSADGLAYTFHLRPDAKWSNGEPVTAQDFAWSIQRMLDPSTAAPKAALFFPLKNAEAYYRDHKKTFGSVFVRTPDAGTLQLELAQPTADFPAIVASGPWIPVHRLTAERLRTGSRTDYVGNGPFVLAGWRPNQDITVRRNPAYWDAARVRLEEIRFLAFDNGDSEERAFRAGLVDVTMDVPYSKLAAYRADQPAVLRNVPLHETRYLALNTTRPPLNDVRVRHALAVSIDRRALAEKILRGGQQPAFSFLPAGLGGYQPATGLTENAAEARRLLREAGFPDGRGFPRLEMSTWGSTVVLEAIQQMWQRELGLTVTIARREGSTHLAALRAGDYDIALAPAIPDYNGASDLFNQLRSGHHGNYPHWTNPDYDRLVTKAGQLDSTARNTTYQSAEKVLLGEMPVIPLYFNAQNFLVQPAVKGWQADRLWTRFYRDVAME